MYVFILLAEKHLLLIQILQKTNTIAHSAAKSDDIIIILHLYSVCSH